MSVQSETIEYVLAQFCISSFFAVIQAIWVVVVLWAIFFFSFG